MDTLLLPSRSIGPSISGHKVCRTSSRTTQGRSDRVLLRTSFSRARSNRLASFKVAGERQLKSGKGRRTLSVKAKLATEEEGSNEANLATEEEVAVEDIPPTDSGSDNAIAQSVALLKTAAKTRKVSASEIRDAFRVLEKGKIDPTGFLSTIGGTKSPGRTWLLVFVIPKEDENISEARGRYFPITAVQRFDGETRTIENGVFLGPLGELTFAGNFVWEKRKLSFILHTLKLKIGSFGPFRIGIGSKDKQITNTDPFFIWYYADEEIIVARGRAGGSSFWVRCARVKKSLT